MLDLTGSSSGINRIIERIGMSYPGFPSIFYSKDALATRTLLLTNENGSEVNLKINWITCVIDPEEENIEKVKQNYLAPYNDNDEGLLDCLDIEDNYEILPTKSGKFITTFHVPSVLIPVIVGPKGSKLKQLQEITQTMIKVPRIHEIGVPVKITGHSERSVASARNQVTLLTLSKREKLPSTHFISIPVNSDEVKANFEKFKMEILNDQATRGIDEKIFQNSEKLHLTVEVLRLLDEFEIESAKQLLSENVKEFLGIILQKPYYKIKLKGVEIMNDDPSEVDVLYAKVEMEENDDLTNFQEIVNQISDLFHMNGYVPRKYDHTTKLHVTLLNSVFRKDEKNERTTFDSSFILKKYNSYNFGTAIFKSIDLSIRFTTGKNGYYNSEISIPI